MSGAKPRLLIVDDNEDNRYTLSMMLNVEGYDDVAVAVDGKEALDTLRAQQFDLLLLDIMMPHVNGYEVLRQLRDEGRLRDLPVVMISAVTEIDSVVRCIELGADDYLPKPFNPVLLRARIAACLEKKRLRDAVLTRSEELSLANDRLRAQWQRLRRVNAFKSEILSKVAHDLKNPLSVILGRTEILTELADADPPATEQTHAQIGHIREAARHLLNMVDQLLSEAMKDALDISIRREPLDLPTLVHEVVEASRPLMEKKQQTIELYGPESLAASGDHDRMRDAIDNLISNAIKYTPDGGRISVSVERDGDQVYVRVRDSGVGLAPEDVSRLFGRFQRLSARPTGGESSTGLGLSIVKRIVELHGGQVTAESPGPGLGATFTVALPLNGRAATQ